MIEKEIKLILDINNFTIRPSPQWVKEKNWYCRVYLEHYDRIEASFISNAILDIDSIAIEFYIHSLEEGLSAIKHQKVSTKYVSLFYDMDRNLDISINHAGFTNQGCDYLFYKDAENDIFMLFGTKEFVIKAIPVDYEEYQLYYDGFYGNWSSDSIDSLLARIWEEYPKA